jgi:hypothetical protein
MVVDFSYLVCTTGILWIRGFWPISGLISISYLGEIPWIRGTESLGFLYGDHAIWYGNLFVSDCFNVDLTTKEWSYMVVDFSYGR